uniref:Fibroblast growth factor receptor substrate 2 n=1 Tax=Aceria tosichella TaxID=561515 RepID=A0A6G1SQ44_9ACAR
MNLVHALMARMSPDQGSLVNSTDQDNKFTASNIDEQGNDISRGQLHVTDDAIVYLMTNKAPISWPLDCIRRYGCIDSGKKLIFEAGRKCSTGQGIYAFRLSRARECVDRLNEMINSKESRLNRQTNESPMSRAKPTSTRIPQRGHASTSTDSDQQQSQSSTEATMDGAVKPLSYVLIDFETTKALNDSAQAHAAMRIK